MRIALSIQIHADRLEWSSNLSYLHSILQVRFLPLELAAASVAVGRSISRQIASGLAYSNRASRPTRLPTGAAVATSAAVNSDSSAEDQENLHLLQVACRPFLQTAVHAHPPAGSRLQSAAVSAQSSAGIFRLGKLVYQHLPNENHLQSSSMSSSIICSSVHFVLLGFVFHRFQIGQSTVSFLLHNLADNSFNCNSSAFFANVMHAETNAE